MNPGVIPSQELDKKWDFGMITRKVLAVWILKEWVKTFSNVFPKDLAQQLKGPRISQGFESIPGHC